WVMTLVFLSTRMDMLVPFVRPRARGPHAVMPAPPAEFPLAPELTKSVQRAIDTLAGHQQFLDRIDADLEVVFRLAFEGDFNHFFRAVRANYHWYTDIEAVEAVFAVDVNRAGEDALLVAEVGLGHGDRAG